MIDLLQTEPATVHCERCDEDYDPVFSKYHSSMEACINSMKARVVTAELFGAINESIRKDRIKLRVLVKKLISGRGWTTGLGTNDVTIFGAHQAFAELKNYMAQGIQE